MVQEEPAVVSEIMESISRLKESRGSPVYKILEDMSAHRSAPMRNGSLQIKKALKSAVKSGLVKEKDGRFKIGLAPKEYATLNFFKKRGLTLPIKQLRRRRGRRSRSRKRRGRRRRRANYEGIELLEKTVGKDGDNLALIPSKNVNPKSLLNLPIKQLRRRRGRRGRSRRRKGKRRRRADFDNIEDFGKDSDEQLSEPMDRGRRRGRRRRSRRRGRKRDIGPDEEVVSASSDSRDISTKESKEKQKTEDNPNPESVKKPEPPEKPETVQPPPEPIRNPENNSCHHEDYHWDGPYGPHFHPPYPDHYGDHYYH